MCRSAELVASESRRLEDELLWVCAWKALSNNLPQNCDCSHYSWGKEKTHMYVSGQQEWRVMWPWLKSHQNKPLHKCSCICLRNITNAPCWRKYEGNTHTHTHTPVWLEPINTWHFIEKHNKTLQKRPCSYWICCKYVNFARTNYSSCHFWVVIRTDECKQCEALWS